MQCDAREILQSEIDRANLVYAQARGRLRSYSHKSAVEEYWKLEAAVSNARMELDVAVGLLEWHLQRHGCGTT
jgi:hypothetical protein